MIELSNLTFEYPSHDASQFPVLNNINLTLKEGENIGLMGANGSGKTTFARCLNTLLLPTQGTVFIDGFDTADAATQSEIRRFVGMVFQNPENQIVSTTVEREIAFGLENLGISYEQMHQIVDDMLSLFKLTDYRRHPPHLLSGGEIQRLALASVMAMSPKYLVFDEPTSLLDPVSRKHLHSLISKLHADNLSKPAAERLTTLFITQYPEDVLNCDRLLILHQGRIVFDDLPQVVFENVTALKKMGVDVPVEYEVNSYLKDISGGKISLNTSDFLPIP
ncbi:MAG: ATP-binding cassette domain-containing protein [bacterium]